MIVQKIFQVNLKKLILSQQFFQPRAKYYMFLILLN